MTPMEKNTVTEKAGYDNGGGVSSGDALMYNLGSGQQPPPFLMKIFEMVDDIETNSMISWNSSGTGFVVWDHNRFSAEILPRHFRTSNFSSFVYQLNNYGFKKISWERYEYANRWFQAGKKHWLKNIKRRITKKRNTFTPDQNSINASMKMKLGAIMAEQNDMKRKIQKLRQSLDNTEVQLAVLETNTKLPECQNEEMKIAVFLNQFMLYLRRKKEEANGENSKRLRLESRLQSTEPADKVEISTQENAENCLLLKNILDDDDDDDAGFYLNGRQEDLAPHHSKAIMELDEMMASNIAIQREILIAKPSDPEMEDDDGHLELWT